MSSQCEPAVCAAPFQFKLDYHNVLASEQESCSTSLKGDAIAACQSYTAWTGYTGSACQFLQGAADVAHKFVSKKNPALAAKIYHGIGIGANIFYGANRQFLQAITDINAGKPYEPIVSPDTPPPFNPDPPTDGKNIENAIVSFWGAFKPWLQIVIGKMADKSPTSPWIKILEGIISSSDLWIKQLQDIFSSASDS